MHEGTLNMKDAKMKNCIHINKLFLALKLKLGSEQRVGSYFTA